MIRALKKEVCLVVELGRAEIDTKGFSDLEIGSVLTLDQEIGSPVDIMLDGKKIGEGEVVVFDEVFGVRITKINKPQREEL